MASNVAAAKNTGGGGFVFEDDVCAWLLACMLSGEPAFDAELGAPIRVDFQTRPDGWFLDDALVTTRAGTVLHRFALSIKSNVQFTASSAPADFVQPTWEQWLHIGSALLNRDQDFMGFVTAPLSAAATASVSGLMEKAGVADPTILPGRLATPNWASEEERRLFASFACPATLRGTHGVTEEDTARLLKRLRFLQHDFEVVTSQSLKQALRLCRTCVRSGTIEDAGKLWNLLRGIAAKYRPKAGSITRQELIDQIRSNVSLADHPDHARDWLKIDELSHRNATQVGNAIAGRIHLPRNASVISLADTLAAAELVAFLGASGTGKSAVARALYEQRRVVGERTIWLDARSLDCTDFPAFESALRLQYSLSELLSAETASNPALILDGLDRIYAESAFRNVVTLLRLLRQGHPATQWRIVIPCQSNEWPRVLDGIQRAGAFLGVWKPVELERLKTADLNPVRDAMPALARLLLLPKVASLLTNLKILDLVARRIDNGATVDGSTWVGESSVAKWFWDAEIERGQDRLARGRFARLLAERQGDQLSASIPVDDFSGSDLAALESLEADRICLPVPGDRIAFAHDLYGDWVRLRVLLNHRDALPSFFQHRRESPLWHRALRLLAIYLLEQDGGVDKWRSLLATFGTEDFKILSDVVLEAPAFAFKARSLLDTVLPDLLANEGILLRRLLTRFLAFATVPNDEMVALATKLGLDPNLARSDYRVPYWPYWFGVLRFLHAHRASVLAVADSEIAHMVQIWIDYTPKGFALRSEVAELGVLLGRLALDASASYRGRSGKSKRESLYVCALAAAHEHPDEVANVALSAAQRLSTPERPEDSAGLDGPRPAALFGGGPPRRFVEWPEGPRARVDEAFQNVVLDGGAISELFRIRPATAREVVLATMIEPPHEEDWNEALFPKRELQIVQRYSWLPGFYTHGPFLACLTIDFREGLELIASLIEFAAARYNDQNFREAAAWRAHALAQGYSAADVDERIRRGLRQELVISDGELSRAFIGDERVYGWSAGFGNPPYAIETALMALEQHLYLQLDAGKDIAEEVGAVLARSKSVALLGVLCDVGKRHQELFAGPLRFLLAAPEIYSWEISKRVQGRSHLMIGAGSKGPEFVELARTFHGLEHRNVDLRQLAPILMIRLPAMREYFDRVRANWQAAPHLGAGSSDIKEQLIVSLDPANYQVREDPKHGTVLVNVEALRIQEQRAGDRQAMEDQMLVTGFPSHCRTILDNRQRLSETKLAELWGQWNRIREHAGLGDKLPTGETRFGDDYASAICGGITVFLWHHEWCTAESSRLEAVLAAFRSIYESPPERQILDGDNSLLSWTWDCFAVEAVAMLWARDISNPEWRRQVAESAFASRYVMTRLLFGRCAEFRAILGDDFSRLRRLALEWAFVRARVDQLKSVHPKALALDDEGMAQVQQEFVKWVEEKITAFVSGSLGMMPADWEECHDVSRFHILDAACKPGASRTRLNFHVVRCANEWIPRPDDARDDRERSDVIQFWRSALRVVIQQHRENCSQRVSRYPSEDESWVLGRVGVAVLQLREQEQPEVLWQPVVDLLGESHDWLDLFAQALHVHALSAARPPASYARLVRMMVQRAFTDVDGARRWSSFERVWDALLGIDPSSCELWEPHHAAVVNELSDVFELWMAQVPRTNRRIAGFATWLKRPAAISLRLRSLSWFLGLIRTDASNDRDDVKEAEDAIATLLNGVWTEDQQRLRADSQAFDAFRGLLSWLGGQQNQLGLELHDRIGNLG